MKDHELNKKQLDQQSFMNKILKNIKEYEQISCEQISSIKFDLEQPTFEICLKPPEGRVN